MMASKQAKQVTRKEGTVSLERKKKKKWEQMRSRLSERKESKQRDGEWLEWKEEEMCVLCQIKWYFPARNGDISSRDGQKPSDSPASP